MISRQSPLRRRATRPPRSLLAVAAMAWLLPASDLASQTPDGVTVPLRDQRTARMAEANSRKDALKNRQLAQALPDLPDYPLDSTPILNSPLDDARDARAFSVMARERPLYDALGVDADLLFGRDSSVAPGYIIYPRLRQRLGYDDNVYRSANSVRGDFFYGIKPEIRVLSNWDNHALEAGFYVDIERYFEEDENDFEDYFGTLRGLYDIGESSAISLQLEGGRLHESRGDPDSPVGIDGVNRYWVGRAILGGRYDVEGADIRAEARYAIFDYLDNGPLDNDGRDYHSYELFVRGSYDFESDLLAYAEASYNWRLYRQDFDISGLNRDSDGYALLAGVVYDGGSVTLIDLSIGYLSQSYDDVLLETVSGFDARAEFIWNPTDLMTVSLSTRRGIQESVLPGVSGILQSSYSAGLDYEITDQILFSSRLQYIEQDFKGITRTDRIYDGRAGVSYLINDNANAEVTVSRSSRRSETPLSEYDSNSILLRLTLQL